MKKYLVCIFFIISTAYIVATSLEIRPTDKQISYQFDLPSNTYHQYCKNIYSQNGEDGILEQLIIELDRSRYERCVANYKAFPHIQIFHGAVLYNDTNNDLHAWLKKGNLPYDLDVLSIDIDYDDYYVWQGLTEYMPKIVIIETNPYRD